MFSGDIKAPEEKNPCNYCLQGGTKAALKGLQLLQSSTKKRSRKDLARISMEGLPLDPDIRI